MIIEVQLEHDEEPRRYRVTRDDGTLRVRRLAAAREGDGGRLVESTVEVDWRSPEPHVYSLILGGHSYDVHVDEDEGDEERLAVHLLSRVVRLRAADARKHRVAKAAAGPDGLVRVTAPMPGRVLKVLTPEGTEVGRGDGIIILEAMKMENEIKAPRDGIVTSVAVREGQGIEGGAVLATIE